MCDSTMYLGALGAERKFLVSYSLAGYSTESVSRRPSAVQTRGLGNEAADPKPQVQAKHQDQKTNNPRTALPRTMAALLIGPGVWVCIVSISAGVLATFATATAALIDWKASKDAEKAEKAENEANEGEGAEAGAKLK